MSPDKISVVVFSQQSLFRQGIEHSLRAMEGIEVLGVSEVNGEVLSILDRMTPNVVIVDLDGPSDIALALAHKVKQRVSSIGIVVLTTNPSDAQLFQALKSQAAAYHGKDITPEELVNAIRRVAMGEHPINEGLLNRPNVADQILQQFQELSQRNVTGGLISPLTERETEILNYIARGFLNKQIAGTLGISEQTIKNHVTSILRKLNANARTEAVVVAIKHGLITIK